MEKWFGENWSDFIKGIDEHQLEMSRESLLRYLPSGHWNGKTFLDIGCGSGIFSLSAFALGVSRVVSIDVDESSIAATNSIKQRLGKEYEDRWGVLHGSVLDDALVERYSAAGDIVYAWGSLHHTGDMKKAIENAKKLVKPKGKLILAIYNEAVSSADWAKIKKWYSGLPGIAKTFVEIPYASAVTLGYMALRRTTNIKKDRGMDVYHDAIDWIRGYPYEYACADDLVAMVEDKDFRMEAIPTKLPCGKGKANLLQIMRAANVGCNEFVFARQ